ncbi:hypothetical protein [Litoribacillus peritrichatus]|uniref:DUF4174 domain-containing protein n=1 Tax=Litoribacillus peritrichatus TaxID=718191 RepID=A0ABP7N5U7_9GAMM
MYSLLKTKLILILIILSPMSFGYEFFLGKNAFSTENISKQLSEDYGVELNVSTVIVAGDKGSNSNYQKQWEVLNGLNAEAMQLITVSSLSDEESGQGYYTDKATAQSILKGTSFKVMVFSSDGREVLSQNKPVSAQTLKAAINQ